MGMNEYKEMFDKMVIPEDMDQNLKNVLLTNQKEIKGMKNNKIIKRVSVAVASAALIFGLCQTPFAGNVTAAIVNYFQYGFMFTKDYVEKTNISMKMDYLTLDKNAPIEDTNMDSIDQVSDAIGIKLLNTKMENKSKRNVHYSPMLADDKKLYGVVVSNQVYSYGDLKNVAIDKKHGEINFDKGKDYKTPIGVQIAIRTDENLTQKYENNELGFVSDKQIVNLDDIASNAEIYEISKLGIKAVLFTVKTDGPILWRIEDGEIECTNAIFVYKGVEYLYYGGITHDTMKAFLETLK